MSIQKVYEEARKSYSKEDIQREISRYTWLVQNVFVFFGDKGGSVHVLTRIVDYEALVGIQY